MVRLVLFDIDGTLIRTGGAGVKAFERTFATQFGIPGATTGVSFAGRTDTSLVRECFQKHKIKPTAANFEKFFDSYVFWLHHLLGCLGGQTFRGVHELMASLQRLADAPVLGLLTGNIRLGAEIKLRHYELWHFFQTGAFGDDHEDRNEMAVIARGRGVAAIGRELAGEEILVIGDTPMDIACGKKIGAKVLAVGTGGYSCEELRRHHPTWAVDHLEAVPLGELCG